MVRPFLFIWLLCLLAVPANAQDTVRKTRWLPPGNLFPTLRFNMLESQTSGALYGIWADGSWENRFTANFSAGFRRNVVRFSHAGGMKSELGMELCVFPQFLFEAPFQTFLVTLFNVEFKVGAAYQLRLNDSWSLRARLYHISAHLGDDYVIRYQITDYPTNRRIYEMLDISAAWTRGPWMVYGTAGCIVHTTYEQNPLAVETGMQWNPKMKHKKWVSWLAGLDIRCEQQGGFRPCLHTGAGVVLGHPDDHPVTIMLDYYNGWMPYSLYDDVLVQWIGASMYFDLF